MRGFSSPGTGNLMEQSESSHLLLQKQSSQPNGEYRARCANHRYANDDGEGLPKPIANGAGRTTTPPRGPAPPDSNEGTRAFNEDDASGRHESTLSVDNCQTANSSDRIEGCGCCNGPVAHSKSAGGFAEGPGSLVLTRLLNIGAKLSNDKKHGEAARNILDDYKNGPTPTGGSNRRHFAPLAALRSRFASSVFRRRRRRRRVNDGGCAYVREVKETQRVSQPLTKVDGETYSAYSKLGSADSKSLHAAECRHLAFDPSAKASHYWNGVVSMAFLYNFWIIAYRFAFDEISIDNYRLWLTLDYLADGIYVLDIGKHFRTAYLDEGVLQTQPAKMRARYMNSTSFYMDCLCLLPLDFLYLSIGFNSLLRLFRVLKVYRFWSFLDCIERHATYPNVVRAATMLHYLLAIFHWNACLLHFLIISEASPGGSDWLPAMDEARAANGTLSSYVLSLHWTVVVLTTTGSLPRPSTLAEYGYAIALMIFSLMLFAAVLGTVANIISSVSAARKDFQAKLDEVKTYMRQYGLPDDLQERVIQWFEYLWANKGNVRDEAALGLLPERLKAEISIHVHLDTLKKVEIFQNTEAGFLKELVLRLRPALFSPGDYVCRKGEVGKEMYIVKKGVLDVLDAGGRAVARLVAGSYFGEISILNMGEVGNRRTASVRSVGYSDLFCLNKKDLWDVLKEYPAARFRLEEIAMQRLTSRNRVSPRKSAARSSPRLLSASSEFKAASDSASQQKVPVNRCNSTPGAVEMSSLVPHEQMVLPRVKIRIEGEKHDNSCLSRTPRHIPAPARESFVSDGFPQGGLLLQPPLLTPSCLPQTAALGSWDTSEWSRGNAALPRLWSHPAMASAAVDVEQITPLTRGGLAPPAGHSWRTPTTALAGSRPSAGGSEDARPSGSSAMATESCYLTMSADSLRGSCSDLHRFGVGAEQRQTQGADPDARARNERSELGALRRRVFQLEKENRGLRSKMLEPSDEEGDAPAADSLF